MTSEPDTDTERTSLRLRFFGCCLAFLSALCFALQGLFFKFVKGLYFTETILLRSVPTLAFVVAIAAWTRSPMIGDKGEWKWLTVCGLCQSLDPCFRYFAMGFIPYADVYALAMSGTMVLTLILGRLLMRESCAVFETVCAVFIVIGIFLVTQPDMILLAFRKGMEADSNGELSSRLLGTSMALLSCVSSTGAALMARKLKNIHYSVVLIYGNIWSILICIALTFLTGEWTLPKHESWLHLLGFIVSGSVYLQTAYQALCYEEAGAVNTIRSSAIPISYILQIAFLKLYPTIYSILGAILISLATIGSGLRAWLRQRRTTGKDETTPLKENAVSSDTSLTGDTSLTRDH